ncbi:MAG: hypothetical protein M9935_10635 [Kiritimatiellae bacterium]|nr:hypothetical protein [Kiritimatiellia bacterium]
MGSNPTLSATPKRNPSHHLAPRNHAAVLSQTALPSPKELAKSSIRYAGIKASNPSINDDEADTIFPLTTLALAPEA